MLLGSLVPWEDAARLVEQERGMLWEEGRPHNFEGRL